LMLPVHLAASAPGARRAMRPRVLPYYRTIHTIFSPLPDSYGDHLPRLRMIEENIANLPFDRFCRDQGVFGDAAEVVDRLQAAREQFGLSQLLCRIVLGTMS